MIEVIALVGRDAGRTVSLPYAVATAMIANGTACRPEDYEKVRIRGVTITAENAAPASSAPSVSEAVNDAPEAATEPAEKEEAVSTDDVAAETETAPPDAAIVVPEGWRDLHWKQKTSLATAIYGEKVETVDDAETIISAYVSR